MKGATRAGMGTIALMVGLALPCQAASRSAEAVLAGEPPELAGKIERERLVVLEDIGEGAESFVVAYVIFERSIEDVLRLLRQAERQPEYRTELASVETVETLEDGRIDEQRLRIMFTKLTYRLRYREDPANGRLDWKLDPDFENDLSKMEGFWELSPFASTPGRTLARFGSSVDVGPAVPRFVQKGLSRRTVLRYLENCRKWIDSDGNWHP